VHNPISLVWNNQKGRWELRKNTTAQKFIDANPYGINTDDKDALDWQWSCFFCGSVCLDHNGYKYDDMTEGLWDHDDEPWSFMGMKNGKIECLDEIDPSSKVRVENLLEYSIRYNFPCSLRVSVGELYKLDNRVVEIYTVWRKSFFFP